MATDRAVEAARKAADEAWRKWTGREGCLDGMGYIARAALAAAEAAAWQPIETALRDRMIWVYAPAYEGLPEIVGPCRWHDDAGFCVDELRSPTHWRPLPSPPPATTGDA